MAAVNTGGTVPLAKQSAKRTDTRVVPAGTE